MDLLGQSALILAVTSFSLAVTVLTKNIRNKLGITFAALCTVVWGWSFFFFLEKIFSTGTFYRLHLTFNLLLGPVALLFVRVFTRVENSATRSFFRLSMLMSLPLLPLQWSELGDSTVVRVLTHLSPVFLAFECLHLMYRDFQISRGTLKGVPKLSTVGLTRRSWMYAGAFFIMITAFMDHVPILGDVIPSIGNVFLCLYLFLISEAVTQQRLLNVSGLLNRVLVLVFLSLCLTVIYTLLVAWIQDSPSLFILNTFLASFIILMLIDPIKKLANVGVMQLFYRQYLKTEEKVDETQRQLTGVLEPVGLAQLTLSFLDNTLKCDSASIFVLRSDGTKYRRIRGLRDEELATREILATHPMIEFVLRMRRRGETPVILDTYLENEIDRSVSQAQRQIYDMILQGLRGLNSNLLIPFIAEQTVLGFAAVRSTMPPEPWGGNWGVLSVIYPFFAQASRTLKNMDVYVRLREKDRLATLGEMAAGLAHEIRNPLGSIKGAAQLLETNRGGNTEPFVNVIVEEVNRLNKVVSQFLDYSRPVAADFVEYDVGQIIDRTLDLFRSAPPEGIRIQAVVPAAGWASLPKLICNPEQIKQVLVNFLQNAVSSVTTRMARQKEQGASVEPGLVQIGAAIQPDSRGGREFVIFVEDNGLGVAREHIEKIFIPFFTTSPTGTGLGLPICSRIIEAHGGRIDVASEEGRSARFSIHIPLKGKDL